MFNRLDFKKNGTECTIEPHELVWLASNLVQGMQNEFSASEINKETLASEQFAKTNPMMHGVTETGIEDPDQAEEIVAAQTYAKQELVRNGLAKSEGSKKVVVNQSQLKHERYKKADEINASFAKAYSAHYEVDPVKIRRALNTVNRHGEFYAGEMDDDEYEQAENFLKTIKQKNKPLHPLQPLSSVQDLIFPTEIFKANSLKEWLSMALRFSNEPVPASMSKKSMFSPPPLEGWWIVVNGRLLSVHNRGKSKFLYASDHGALDTILTNSLNCLSGLSFDPDFNVMVNHARGVLSRADETAMAAIKKLFTMTCYSLLMNAQHVNYLDSLIEALNDFPELSKTPNLFERLLTDPQINQNLNADVSLKAEGYFDLAVEHLRYLSKLVGQFHLYSVSGKSYYPTYLLTQQFMHERDCQLYNFTSRILMLKDSLDIGDRSAILRPRDAYGEVNEGDSYTKFAQSILDCQKKTGVSDAIIAQNMRRIISGERINTAAMPFLPNLAVVMFCSEVARIPRLILTNIMLLDLIENNFSAGTAHPAYKWLDCFASPQRVKNGIVLRHQEVEKETCSDLYGKPVKLICFDGLYTQAHFDSSKNHPFPVLDLSVTQQKEALIILNWLLMSIENECRHAGITITARSEDRIPVHNRPWDVEKICFGGVWSEKLSKKASNIPEIALKWDVVHNYILPALRRRLACTDNLLAAQPGQQTSPLLFARFFHRMNDVSKSSKTNSMASNMNSNN